MSTPPPFSSFEVFLFEALTLRSNAVYRQDVDKLMEYEAERDKCEWVKHYKLGDRPYQAAQSIIATWELICRIAEKSYGSKSQRDAFFEAMLPLGPMYLWLRPAIDVINDDHRHGEKYAEHFQRMGKEALSRLPDYVKMAKGFDGGDIDMLSGNRRTEAYITAWKQFRPLTHFG